MKVESFYIFLIFCLFAVTPLYSQSASNSGSIYGKVQDTAGSVLGGVYVSLESDVVVPVSTTTSTNGNFRFVNLPPGNYSLTFFSEGYMPVKQNDIVVSTGAQLQVNVILEPASNNNGIISGVITDKNGTVVEGVSVTLESDTVPKLFATTASDGTYRFEGLPAGKYVLLFRKKGYLELEREQIELPTGSNVQVNVELVSKVAPEKAAIPVVEKRFTGISWAYSRDYFRLIPNSNSIYTILEQTPAIDLNTFTTVNSNLAPSGQFITAYARGADHFNTVWNYDGLNITVPDGQEDSRPDFAFPGNFPTFFPLEDTEEVQVITAGNDISIPTSGSTVNIVSKQGGREWYGSGSFFYSDDNLESTNTPEEFESETGLIDRLSKLQEYHFELGGPIIQDKLFIWGALFHGRLNRLNIYDELEQNRSTSYSLKANLNLTSAHQFQFGYFRADHRSFIDFFDYLSQTEQKPQTVLPGVWMAQYSWTPNNNTFLQARYGYVGAGHSWGDVGFEDGGFARTDSEQAAHDVTLELDRFMENLLGGDHEFRFGFEYKTTHFSDANPYLNPYDPGLFFYADDNALPDEPLTEGSIAVYYPDVPRMSRITRTSLYASDSYRKGRLAVNLGLRFDRQTGKNEARTYPSPLDLYGTPDFLGPGFENLIPPIDYPENTPGTAFDNFSPRIGATYDLMGNGRTLIYGSAARYYEAFDKSLVFFPEVFPLFSARYTNLNNDQVITRDEVLNASPYSAKDTLSKYLYDSDLSNRYVNEYVIGIQTNLRDVWSLSAAVTHRSYGNFIIGIPVGYSPESFVFSGTTVLQTPFGDFVKPLFTLPDFTDNGTAVLQNNRSYTQTYDSFELMLQKSMDRNFMLGGGLVLQRRRGHHYAEGIPPFYLRQPSTSNIGPSVNYEVFENQGFNYFGDSYPQWELKLSGAYILPWQLSLGAFLRYQQGSPYVLFGFEPLIFWFTGPHGPSGFFLVEPIGERRHDNVFTLDLRVNKEFRFKDYGSLNLIVEIFNVTNANTIIGRNNHLGDFDEQYIFQPDPNLNRIGRFLSPRVVRLGLRYSF